MGHLQKIALGGCFVLAVLFVHLSPQEIAAETDALEMIINATDARLLEGEVQYYAMLDYTYWTLDELEEVLNETAKLIGVEKTEVRRSEAGTYRVADMNAETLEGSIVHIVLQSNPGDDYAGISPQSYLLVVCRDKNLANIKQIAEQLETMLRPVAPNGQISYCLTGELSGSRTTEEMTLIAHTALSAVNGLKVEDMRDETLVSVTAYTPLLDRHLTVDGERMNLNVAVRYDSRHDRTLLWAGFPLIQKGY